MTDPRLTRGEILDLLRRWYRAWDAHDLPAVLGLFHEAVVFENWTGARVEGREALSRAWREWFAGENFRFEEEETFVDETAQTALYRWTLRWPSTEPGREGRPEVRRGVDVLHFAGGRIVRKLTYCRTGLEIAGERVRLAAPAIGDGRGRTP